MWTYPLIAMSSDVAVGAEHLEATRIPVFLQPHVHAAIGCSAGVVAVYFATVLSAVAVDVVQREKGKVRFAATSAARSAVGFIRFEFDTQEVGARALGDDCSARTAVYISINARRAPASLTYAGCLSRCPVVKRVLALGCSVVFFPRVGHNDILLRIMSPK